MVQASRTSTYEIEGGIIQLITFSNSLIDLLIGNLGKNIYTVIPAMLSLMLITGNKMKDAVPVLMELLEVSMWTLPLCVTDPAPGEWSPCFTTHRARAFLRDFALSLSSA